MLYYAHRISLKSPTSSSFEMQACALPVNIDKIYVTIKLLVCLLSDTHFTSKWLFKILRNPIIS